jgi:hypothetical protein
MFSPTYRPRQQPPPKWLTFSNARARAMQVNIKDVRLAFPNIWEPKQFNGTGEPACNANFIIEKTNKAALDAVMNAIKQVAQEKWGAKAMDTLKTLKAKGDLCLHDGAEKAEYEGFEGNYFVSARNKARPVVVDRGRSPLTQADGKPYAGCFVNASIDIWPQDNSFGKRVNAKLLAIQFVRDGAAFGGGAMGSADDFDDLDDGDGGGEPATANVGDDDALFG